MSYTINCVGIRNMPIGVSLQWYGCAKCYSTTKVAAARSNLVARLYTVMSASSFYYSEAEVPCMLELSFPVKSKLRSKKKSTPFSAKNAACMYVHNDC